MANALKAILIVSSSYVVAFATNVPLVFRLAYAVTAIILVGFFWSRRTLSAMEINRQPSQERAQVGQSLTERFQVRNKSWLPGLSIEVVDKSSFPNHLASRAIALRPKEAKSWEVTTVCTERGKFTLGPYWTVTTDPFSVFKWRKFIPQSWTVVVYPRTHDLPHFHLTTGELTGGQSVRQRTFFVTPNVAGIRDYAPGDSFNRIHWPSTARVRRLMSKEFELDPASDVWIALDLQRSVHLGRGQESTTEYGIAVAASLARHLLDENRSVGLIANGAGRLVVHCDRGERQLLKLLEDLAMARADGDWSLVDTLAAEGTRFGRNTTLIAISPSTDESWVRALEHTTQQGIRSIAVHLEASSFGQAPHSMLLLGALTTLNIPTFVIKNGDAIGEILCLSS